MNEKFLLCGLKDMIIYRYLVKIFITSKTEVVNIFPINLHSLDYFPSVKPMPNKVDISSNA